MTLAARLNAISTEARKAPVEGLSPEEEELVDKITKACTDTARYGGTEHCYMFDGEWPPRVRKFFECEGLRMESILFGVRLMW